MTKVATKKFATINTLFKAYLQKMHPSGSSPDIPASELKALLGDLESLDRSIVTAFDNVLSLKRPHTNIRDRVIREQPDSELARLLSQATLVQSAFALGYADPDHVQGPEREELLRLQSVTPAFYYKAHRLLKLLDSVPSFKNITRDQKCKGMMIVRNQLLEHAESQDSNRKEWSFGLDSHLGPRIRPLIFGNKLPSHVDGGYFINRDNLLELLRSRLKSVCSTS